MTDLGTTTTVPIEFEWRFDEKQLRRLAAISSHTWKRLLLMAGLGAAVGAVFSFASGDGAALVGGLLSAWVAVLLLVTVARLTSSVTARAPKWIYDTTRYVLDARGVTVAQPMTSSWSSWATFTDVRVTKRFLLLQRRGARAIALPLPALVPEQVQQIRELVAAGGTGPPGQPVRSPTPDRGE